ncbi:shikimate dehydrogenase [Marimonas arenosa]|uniref:Shikimate dehydrogenase (NADP(+)) n=1 Tax=Marimonas arenosa TaxID=1795305 RepID=A0AAE4B640_9RHOB|nr:shikimate dehydrogenase [Marimonas arenosa]MDQ2091822.1 shikimate dehydrogenase [Marimonas arenosa]
MARDLGGQIAEAVDGAGPDTVLVGLIGKGIQRSRSPAMHMEEARAQGIDLRYVLFDPDAWSGAEPAVQDMLAAVEAAGFAGVNVTYPYKKAVVAHLDVLSESPRQVGAVNTVVFRDGRRHGHNTDFWGYAESLRRGLPAGPFGTVLLLGAGGAGSAVAHALKSLGVRRLLIADTDRDAAATLAAAAAGAVCVDLAAAAAQADGIVNATPVGMVKLPGTAIDPALLEPRQWVSDVVYFPLETELLAAARARGCTCLNGAGMAVFQAVRAFELFTGREAVSARMRATFDAFDHAARAGGERS